MSNEDDESYLVWLYAQIGSVRLRNKATSFWDLARVMFTTEFTWFVPNDDNRAEDGRDLRLEFMDETGYEPDEDWLDLGCSMLEMMIALSRRLSFEADGGARDWFWQLVANLGLEECNDRSNFDPDRVTEILQIVCKRTYAPTGQGGLFPLRNPEQDQRRVELWDQQSAYIRERF